MVACVSLGIWMSQFVFNQYETKAVTNTKVVYLLSIGSYPNKKQMEKELTKVDTYLVEEENDIYFAYIAITSNEKNYDKLKKYYIKKGFKVTQRQKILKDDEFMKTLEKYDLLLEKSTEDTTIPKLEKELIKKYKEVNNG